MKTYRGELVVGGSVMVKQFVAVRQKLANFDTWKQF